MSETKRNLEHVKNPLGIIALSLVLVEAIAALVIGLSTLTDIQNLILTIFIVVFPVFVMITFYLLVTKHHAKLYGPEDFVNPDDFRLIFLAYNRVSNRKEEQSVPLNQLGKYLTTTFSDMEKSISNIKLEIENTPRATTRLGNHFQKNTIEETRRNTHKVLVSDFIDQKEFISHLNDEGFNAEEYVSTFSKSLNDDMHDAIWLGKNVPIEIAKPVIATAIKYFPELKYIHISGDYNQDPPLYVHDQIFIGGTTSAAKRLNLGEFTDKEFHVLVNSNTIEELHELIRLKYINK